MKLRIEPFVGHRSFAFYGVATCEVDGITQFIISVSTRACFDLNGHCTEGKAQGVCIFSYDNKYGNIIYVEGIPEGYEIVEQISKTDLFIWVVPSYEKGRLRDLVPHKKKNKKGRIVLTWKGRRGRQQYLS